jgi:hypothetical protein
MSDPRRLVVVNGGRGPHAVMLFSDGPQQRAVAMRSALDGSGANGTDPWAFFWASMLAAIIQSTDEELAESLMGIFGEGAEPPKPETLSRVQFDDLPQVSFRSSVSISSSAAAEADRPEQVSADEGDASGGGSAGGGCPADPPEAMEKKARCPTVSYPDSCPICMCDFTESAVLKQLPCKHHFHERCIRQWLLEKSTTCPTCRTECRPCAPPPVSPLASAMQAPISRQATEAEALSRRDSITSPNMVPTVTDGAAAAAATAAQRSQNPSMAPGFLLRRSGSRSGDAAHQAGRRTARSGTVSRLRRLTSVARQAELSFGEMTAALPAAAPSLPNTVVAGDATVGAGAAVPGTPGRRSDEVDVVTGSAQSSPATAPTSPGLMQAPEGGLNEVLSDEVEMSQSSPGPPPWSASSSGGLLRGVAAVEGLSRRERQTARLVEMQRAESDLTAAMMARRQAVASRGAGGAGEGGSGGAQPVQPQPQPQPPVQRSHWYNRNRQRSTVAAVETSATAEGSHLDGGDDGGSSGATGAAAREPIAAATVLPESSPLQGRQVADTRATTGFAALRQLRRERRGQPSATSEEAE